MKLRTPQLALFIATSMACSPVFADSNASGGVVVNSETVTIGPGPFNHGSAIGSPENTSVTGVTFVGGFNATDVRFSGTLMSVIGGTWGSEADIQISQGMSDFTWQNPSIPGVFGTVDYDSSQALTGDFMGGTDPGIGGAWNVEFIDTFNDGLDADATSTNVDMTFEEISEIVDTNGNFSLGSLSGGDSANSVGEFAVSNLFDLYNITLNQAGLFSFFTGEDPMGFVGTTVDTEIGIFDASGVLIAQDDDGGSGLFSGIFDLNLSAGDYTLAVTSFASGTSFGDGFEVIAGDALGDYTIGTSLVATDVSVSGIMALFGLSCFGLVAQRKRKTKVHTS